MQWVIYAFATLATIAYEYAYIQYSYVHMCAAHGLIHGKGIGWPWVTTNHKLLASVRLLEDSILGIKTLELVHGGMLSNP